MGAFGATTSQAAPWKMVPDQISGFDDGWFGDNGLSHVEPPLLSGRQRIAATPASLSRHAALPGRRPVWRCWSVLLNRRESAVFS
ncbi:hypothetical protein, partial [Mycolicibacter terrae]|uniref:hypothetical protein n=1 Tax=Mycolicibacter terrae TaxID=1788 RepID=UPI001C8C125B